MVSAIFILDQKGKPLIFRKYRDDCPSDVPQRFMKYGFRTGGVGSM